MSLFQRELPFHIVFRSIEMGLICQLEKNPTVAGNKSRQITHLLYTSRPILLGAGSSGNKESACGTRYLGSIHGQEDPWKRACQTTPVFLLRESPWTEELGGLQSKGLSVYRAIKCWTGQSDYTQQTSQVDIVTFRNSFSHQCT